MEDSGQSPVRRLDFLVRGAGGDAENLVERRARGVQIRRSRLLRPGRASFRGGGGGGEGNYRPGFDAARRRSHGVAGEVNGGKRRWKGHGRNHVRYLLYCDPLGYGNWEWNVSNEIWD